jgi:hypothetical protein
LSGLLFFEASDVFRIADAERFYFLATFRATLESICR